MVALQIHLTEPSLILPGAPAELESSTRQNDNDAIQSPSHESNTDKNAINMAKQRPGSSAAFTQLSGLWPSNPSVHSPEADSENGPSSNCDLSSEKTSMVRGFVVLHVSQAINFNRLSIKLAGRALTLGPEAPSLASSCNSTILISEEYTIKGSSSPAVNPQAPPYSSANSTSIEASSSGHSSLSFSWRLSQSANKQSTFQRQTRSSPLNRPSQSILKNLDNPNDLRRTLRTTSQSPDRRGRRHHNSNNSADSFLFGSSLSHYFDRRSHSAGWIGNRSRIPLETETQTGDSTELSSFVMVNTLSNNLVPIYQDSVFHNMLANQYNLLSDDRFLVSNRPKAPSYEAHYHCLSSSDSIVNESGGPHLAGPDWELVQTPSKRDHLQRNQLNKFKKHGRYQTSASFKDGFGQLMDALKLKKSSTSFNSLKLQKVTSVDLPRRDNQVDESFESRRPHSALAQTYQLALKKSHEVKNGGKRERRNSDSLGFHKFGWVLNGSRQRSSIGKNPLKECEQGATKNSINLKKKKLGGAAGRQSQPWISRRPFGSSNCSTFRAPDQSKANILEPGVYKYPFVVPVPNHLPPSINCCHGSISYSLEATLVYQESQDPTLLTNHQQIPINLVDPMAGSPTLNASCRPQLSGEEDAVNEVYSSYSGINIERTWEDQLYYQIRLDTRKFLTGGNIGFEIQFNALSPMKIHRFQAEIEEKTQYFMDHEKQYLKHCDSHSFTLVKLEQAPAIVLINKDLDNKYGALRVRSSDVPLLPIISDDQLFVTKSPLLPHVKVNSATNSGKNGSYPTEAQAISELSSWTENSGPWTLRFDLRLPCCQSSSPAGVESQTSEGDGRLDKQSRGLNFTCQHKKSPIVVKHNLKLRMRVERGDDSALDKRGRRKKYDIILSSPIQILSCQCRPYSLPAYASSDPTDMTEILRAFHEINTSKGNSTASIQCNCTARAE